MRVSVFSKSASKVSLPSIKQRFEEGLERYASLLDNVLVRLRDENGPRGGRDQACLVQVSMRNGQSFVVKEQSESVATAIGGALTRAKRIAGERINAIAKKRRHQESARRNVEPIPEQVI